MRRLPLLLMLLAACSTEVPPPVSGGAVWQDERVGESQRQGADLIVFVDDAPTAEGDALRERLAAVFERDIREAYEHRDPLAWATVDQRILVATPTPGDVRTITLQHRDASSNDLDDFAARVREAIVGVRSATASALDGIGASVGSALGSSRSPYAPVLVALTRDASISVEDGAYLVVVLPDTPGCKPGLDRFPSLSRTQRFRATTPCDLRLYDDLLWGLFHGASTACLDAAPARDPAGRPACLVAAWLKPSVSSCKELGWSAPDAALLAQLGAENPWYSDLAVCTVPFLEGAENDRCVDAEACPGCTSGYCVRDACGPGAQTPAIRLTGAAVTLTAKLLIRCNYAR